MKSEFVCGLLLIANLARNMTRDATAPTIISVDILLTCFLLTLPEDQRSDLFYKSFKSKLRNLS